MRIGEIEDLKALGLSEQCIEILLYLDTEEWITPLTALSELGVFRLAARIHEIRSKTLIQIEDEMVRDRNRFGKMIHYKKYRKAICE